MQTDATILLSQFEPLDQLFKAIENVQYPSMADLAMLVTRCTSCVNRIAGPNSDYAARLREEAQRKYMGSGLSILNVRGVYGVTQALKADISAGYLTTLRELIHADLFSDFLENAQYFLSEGHKDPAAVITGGVLEEHLRQLCQKNGIKLEFTNTRGEVKHKMGDTLNSDLYKANVYGKPEQAQVIAWLALRNMAAHGKYGDYTQEQIALFLQGLRNFIAMFPA